MQNIFFVVGADSGQMDLSAVVGQLGQLSSLERKEKMGREREGAGQRWDDALVGVLKYLFISTRKYDIDEVARKMGMEYDDLYAFVSGRRTMPAPALFKLVSVTHEMLFMDIIAKDYPEISIRWKKSEIEEGR